MCGETISICHACMANEDLSCMHDKGEFAMHAWQKRV